MVNDKKPTVSQRLVAERNSPTKGTAAVCAGARSLRHKPGGDPSHAACGVYVKRGGIRVASSASEVTCLRCLGSHSRQRIPRLPTSSANGGADATAPLPARSFCDSEEANAPSVNSNSPEDG